MKFYIEKLFNRISKVYERQFKYCKKIYENI